MSFATEQSQADAIRPMPHAVGPEKAVLSVLLRDPEEFFPVATEEGLTMAHFHLPAHSILFEFISELFLGSDEIEMVSLIQKLLDSGKLACIGGPSKLTDLYTYAPSPGHFRQHIAELKTKLIARSLIELGNETIAGAFDSPDEIPELMAATERKITAIASIGQASTPPKTIKDLMGESFARFEARVKGSESSQGIPTHPLLDERLHGAHPGRMWIVGAYPEGGKSVLCSQMILNAIADGHPALFLSLEMSERDLMDRLIVQSARIEARAFTEPKAYAIENGGEEINTGLMKAINRIVPSLGKSPLRIYRPPNRNLATVVSAIRRAHREMGIKIAVVDFIQKVIGPKSDTREMELAGISGTLFELAGELGITIIVASQLNADGETKHARTIEEDADVVLNIVQDRNKDSDTYKAHRFILIAKDRHYGSGGTRIRLILDRAIIRFVEGDDQSCGEKQKPKYNR